MLEEVTRVEREPLTAEIAGELRRQEAQQKKDAELAKDSDSILEHKGLNLKTHVRTQDATWQQILQDHEERADKLLKQQKENAATWHEQDRQEARDPPNKQRFKFQTLIQNLTAIIECAEKPHHPIQPTGGGNGEPGPSNRVH